MIIIVDPILFRALSETQLLCVAMDVADGIPEEAVCAKHRKNGNLVLRSVSTLYTAMRTAINSTNGSLNDIVYGVSVTSKRGALVITILEGQLV